MFFNSHQILATASVIGWHLFRLTQNIITICLTFLMSILLCPFRQIPSFFLFSPSVLVSHCPTFPGPRPCLPPSLPRSCTSITPLFLPFPTLQFSYLPSFSPFSLHHSSPLLYPSFASLPPYQPFAPSIFPFQLCCTSHIQVWISPPNYSSSPLCPWNSNTRSIFSPPFHMFPSLSVHIPPLPHHLYEDIIHLLLLSSHCTKKLYRRKNLNIFVDFIFLPLLCLFPCL